ncbi:MAG: tetratricopeptide repeat protein [Pseudomonadota bacterium]
MRLWLTLIVILFLSACATGPVPVPQENPAARMPEDRAATPAVTAPEVKDRGLSAPVERLLQEALALRTAGSLDASFARLERALRISPNAPEVYLALAQNYQLSGNSASARSTAERGLPFCYGEWCRELRAFLRD